MKHTIFLQERHRVSCYSCCYTSYPISHERQQEIIKEHLTFVECSLTS